jgi:hypothetical protein
MSRRVSRVCALRGALLSAVAFGLLIAAPGSAGAATQLGQTFTSTIDTSDGYEMFQTTSLGGQYAAPSSGVITAWSFQAGATPPQGLKLKIARHISGADYTVVGQSSPKSPPANQLSTYTDVRIPVQTGDLLGMYSGMGPGQSNLVRFDSAYVEHERPSDTPPGSSNTFNPYPIQLDISARLEPDCNHNGLGDETQDPNVSGPGCPATGQRAAALASCKKRAHKHHWSHKRRKKCKGKANLLPV